MILKCNCYSKFQDKEHGPGMRVHNHNNKGGPGQPNYRCTVCGNERTWEWVRPGRKNTIEVKNENQSDAD